MSKVHGQLLKNLRFYAQWHEHPWHNNFHWILFFIFFSFTSTIVTIGWIDTSDAISDLTVDYANTNLIVYPNVAFAVIKAEKDIPRLTMELLNTQDAHRRASIAKKNEHLATMAQKARERRTTLLSMIDSNPELLINNGLSEEAIKKFPHSIVQLLEQPLTIEGDVSVYHLDNFELGYSRDNYVITQKYTNKKYTLHIPTGPITIFPGTHVIVNGLALDNEVAVNSAETIDSVTIALAAPAETKKVAVVLFDFQNSTTTPPYTATHARGITFTNANSANYYFQEASFGEIGLAGKVRGDGDVFGWYRIPYSDAGCDSKTINGQDYNFRVWSNAAKAQAQTAGVDFTGYDHIIYGFPKATGCSWSGRGELGGKPATSWINGNYLLGAVVHELGHNFYTHHAGGYNCNVSGQRVPISTDTNCRLSEYADPFDVMGKANAIKHFSNYHKGQTGTYAPNWLVAANTQTVTENGDYTIAPIELASGNIQSLRIPRDTSPTGVVSQYYYLEFRQPFGYDNFNLTSPVVNGVTIRLAPGYSAAPTQTKLIDTASSTTTFDDAPLRVDQIFTDPLFGITVQTLGVSSLGATVRVTLAPKPCAAANPSLTVTPINQSALAGQTLSYALTLTNRDETSCSPATFTVTPTLPNGWTQTSSLFTELLAPGASITRTFNITADSAAAAQNYTFNQTATNTNSPEYQTVTNATFVVLPEDFTPPVITITNPSNGEKIRKGGGNLQIDTTVSDISGVSSISIFFDGNVLKTCINSTSCTADYPIKSLTDGTHVIVVNATDASINQNSNSGSITISR